MKRKVEAAGERLVAANRLAQRAGHLVSDLESDGFSIGLNRDRRRMRDGLEEPGDFLAATNRGANTLQLCRYCIWAQCMLGKSGPARFLAIASIFPFGMDCILLGRKVINESKRHLLWVR